MLKSLKCLNVFRDSTLDFGVELVKNADKQFGLEGQWFEP